ncbi:hypothetical protein GJ496_011347 [Pomphorhynchus laevis]|nr:hypothetical protein GJ496_011347 [Pomphorhynchus laevis]
MFFRNNNNVTPGPPTANPVSSKFENNSIQINTTTTMKKYISDPVHMRNGADVKETVSPFDIQCSSTTKCFTNKDSNDVESAELILNYLRSNNCTETQLVFIKELERLGKLRGVQPGDRSLVTSTSDNRKQSEVYQALYELMDFINSFRCRNDEDSRILYNCHIELSQILYPCYVYFFLYLLHLDRSSEACTFRAHFKHLFEVKHSTEIFILGGICNQHLAKSIYPFDLFFGVFECAVAEDDSAQLPPKRYSVLLSSGAYNALKRWVASTSVEKQKLLLKCFQDWIHFDVIVNEHISDEANVTDLSYRSDGEVLMYAGGLFGEPPIEVNVIF